MSIKFEWVRLVDSWMVGIFANWDVGEFRFGVDFGWRSAQVIIWTLKEKEEK